MRATLNETSAAELVASLVEFVDDRQAEDLAAVLESTLRQRQRNETNPSDATVTVNLLLNALRAFYGHQQSAPEPPRLVSVKEAAAELGKTVNHVRNLCARGKIQGAHKIGRDWLIPTPVTQLGQQGAGRPPKTTARRSHAPGRNPSAEADRPDGSTEAA